MFFVFDSPYPSTYWTVRQYDRRGGALLATRAFETHAEAWRVAAVIDFKAELARMAA